IPGRLVADAPPPLHGGPRVRSEDPPAHSPLSARAQARDNDQRSGRPGDGGRIRRPVASEPRDEAPGRRDAKAGRGRWIRATERRRTELRLAETFKTGGSLEPTLDA